MTHGAVIMSGYDIPEADSPGEDEANLAEEASRILTARMAAAEPPQLRLPGKYGEEKVRLPQTAVRMLLRILDGMATGNAMMLVPVDSELTTQQAAHMLNVSRPTLIQLLSDGKIAFRKVGTHRRVRCADVIAYKHATDRERSESVMRNGTHTSELAREHVH